MGMGIVVGCRFDSEENECDRRRDHEPLRLWESTACGGIFGTSADRDKAVKGGVVEVSSPSFWVDLSLTRYIVVAAIQADLRR